MRFLPFLLACALAAALPAGAQLRTIPEEAKRGEIRRTHDAALSIDGREVRLAPGAQIRDPSNRLLVPTAVPERAPVRYLYDPQGMVRHIWILTAEEAAKR